MESKPNLREIERFDPHENDSDDKLMKKIQAEVRSGELTKGGMNDVFVSPKPSFTNVFDSLLHSYMFGNEGERSQIATLFPKVKEEADRRGVK